MDVTPFAEGEFINADMVKGSPSKLLKLCGEITAENTDFGVRLQLVVEIDGRVKKYTPNRDTIKNCMNAWGKESGNWLGGTISLRIVRMKGKDMIIGEPVGEHRNGYEACQDTIIPIKS